MAKYSDKTESEWNELIAQWHNSPSTKCSLQEYLALNDIEYLKLMHGIDEQNITDTQVSEKASKIVKDVVTELLIKPSFEKAMQLIRQ